MSNRDPATLTGHEPFGSSTACPRSPTEGGAHLGSSQQHAEGGSPSQADATAANARPQGRRNRRRREPIDPSEPGGNLDSRRRY